MKRFLIAVLIICSNIASALAQEILNGSFENSSLGFFSEFVGVPINSNIITNWNVVIYRVEYISDYWTSSEGFRSVDLNELQPGAIAQTFETTLGKKYAIQFDLSGNPTCLPNIKTLEVSAGNSVQQYTFDITGKTQKQMGWVTRIFEFTAISNTTSLVFKSLTESACGPAIDNIKFVELDCAGVINGISILDSCGVCNNPNSSLFNSSCSDCFGVLFGTAIKDSCGICLPKNSPDRNKTCLDCSGIPNGTSVFDSCGICLKIGDPLFNKSCSDCAGIPNGSSIFDSCGVCLTIGDSLFNKSCLDCNGNLFGEFKFNDCGQCLNPSDPDFNNSCDDLIIFPNIFSPNGDGINDTYIIKKNPKNPFSIIEFSVFSRWGELIHSSFQTNEYSEDFVWDGSFMDRFPESGLYNAVCKVAFANGISKVFYVQFNIVY